LSPSFRWIARGSPTFGGFPRGLRWLPFARRREQWAAALLHLLKLFERRHLARGVGQGGRRTISERSFTRSARSPEDRRPIGDLTSKLRPDSEPALFFFCVPTGHHRRGTRDLLPFAGTSHGEDEVYFFSRSRRAILGTLPAARRASPLPRPLRLSQHATCHGGVSVTSLRHAGSAGLCPTTSCGWARRSPVALTFTRLTLPRACLRFGSRSSLCPVSLLTRKPKKGPNSEPTLFFLFFSPGPGGWAGRT